MNKSDCDILIHNGQIITMDPERRIYHPGAVAITGSRIVEVGVDADMRRRFEARETLDAGGGIVHPGFIDAHKSHSPYLVQGGFWRCARRNRACQFRGLEGGGER